MSSREEIMTETKSGQSLTLFALSFAILSNNLVMLWGNESIETFFIIGTFSIAVIVLQIALISLLFRSLKSRFWESLAFACAAFTNLACLQLLYWERFLTISPLKRTLGSLAAFLVLFSVAWLSRGSRKMRLMVVSAAIAVMISNVAIPNPTNYLYPSNPDALKKWSKVEFKSKPNIHLISFDSMIPERVAQKYLGISRLNYVSVIKDSGSYIVPNTFVAQAPSKPSLNAVIKLDDNTFKGFRYFNGEQSGPLSSVFRANGYKIAGGFSSGYLGEKKGEFYDDYVIEGEPSQSVACIVKSRKLFDFLPKQFGFCELSTFIEKDRSGSNPVEWPDLVLSRIIEKARSQESWVTFHYIYDPIGHAGSITHDKGARAEYVEHFRAQSEKAGNILRRMITAIRENDPEAIVLVFGDHGTWVSRELQFDDDPTFFVQDRYAVFASLLKTNHECGQPSVLQFNETYTTPSRVVASVMRCLAKDPKTVEEAVNFSADYPFENFLYDVPPVAKN